MTEVQNRPAAAVKSGPVETSFLRKHGVSLLVYLLLTVVLVAYSMPSVGVILTAFKTQREISREGVWNLPNSLALENFESAWDDGNVYTGMLNSLQVTIPATLLSIALSVLTGYTFSKLKFRGSELLFLYFVAGMFFPPQIILIPLFRLFNDVGLYDTLWPMIIVHTAMGIPICTLVLKNFFTTVPTAIREAAIIDGAGEFQVLTRVMLPLSLPSLAVLATLQFTWIWNDFLWPVVFTRSEDMRTIMVGLVALKGEYTVAYGSQAAMALFASAPTLLVFIFFQKYFIRGLTMGSVKG